MSNEEVKIEIDEELIEDQTLKEQNLFPIQVKKKFEENADFLCDQCEYTGSRQALRYHKKSKHNGIKLSCDHCDYETPQKSNLKNHRERKHPEKYSFSSTKEKEVIYSCNQCEYTGSRQALRYHIRSLHDGIRLSCDQCNYETSQQSNLKRHKETEHELIKYSCDQCEYRGSSCALRNHVKTKHSSRKR